MTRSALTVTTPAVTRLAPELSVGYYGGQDRNRRDRWTPVHVHRQGHGPVCGARLAQYMGFQWCSNSNIDWVECGNCRRMLKSS